MPRTPVRFPRPKSQQTAPQGSSFDIWKQIDELKNLYTALTDGIALVRRALATWKDIKQGPPGKPGKPGLNGTNVTIGQVEAAVRKYLVQPKNGDNGVAPTAAEVATALWSSKRFRKAILSATAPKDMGAIDTPDEKLEAAEITTLILAEFEKMGIPIEALKNIENRFAEIRNHVATKTDGMRGGGDTVVAGTGVTITSTVNGNKQINASGSLAAWKTPAETPDGIITVFTVTGGAPTDVVADGTAFYNGAGYTYAANQITFVNPPTSYVRYR
jgi:nucleoside diphosphate kinase